MKMLNQKSSQRGSAIVLVMVAVLVLSLTGVGLLSLGARGRIRAVRTAEEIEARCAADAGLVKAIYEMNQLLETASWDDSSWPYAMNERLPNSSATFTYNVTQDDDGDYIVESVGNRGQVIKTVYVTTGLQGLFEYAIFGDSYVELKNNSVVDWANYDDDDKPLKIGTNAVGKDDLVLHNDCLVKGNVSVGFGSNPDEVIKLDVGAVIEGNAYSATESWDLPEVEVPQWLEDLPSLGDIEEPNTITLSGKYEKISLKNSDILTIDGAVVLYVTDYLGLDTNAQLVISDTNPDARLTLYLGGNLITNNGDFLNNLTKDPKRLTIYCVEGCDKVELKTDCDFYGTIYGPDTDLIMRNSVNIYGAVVGKTFIQYKAATFTYDPSLREVSVYDEGVSFVVKHWTEQ